MMRRNAYARIEQISINVGVQTDARQLGTVLNWLQVNYIVNQPLVLYILFVCGQGVNNYHIQ